MQPGIARCIYTTKYWHFLPLKWEWEWLSHGTIYHKWHGERARSSVIEGGMLRACRSRCVLSSLLLLLLVRGESTLVTQLLVMFWCLITSYHAGTQSVITLSAVPKSRNVSAGTPVEFTCATTESGVTLGITTTPTVVGSVANQTDLPNGGNLFSLSFTAPPQDSSITVTCIAFRDSDIFQSTALLMIQGNMAECCINILCMYACVHVVFEWILL